MCAGARFAPETKLINFSGGLTLRLILRILINAVALWLTAVFLPQFILTKDLLGILIVSIIFGLVNALIRPIFLLLSLPINVVTLGLFSLVINTGMLLLTAGLAGDMLSIEGNFFQRLLVAFFGSIIISLVSMIANWILPDRKK